LLFATVTVFALPLVRYYIDGARRTATPFAKCLRRMTTLHWKDATNNTLYTWVIHHLAWMKCCGELQHATPAGECPRLHLKVLLERLGERYRPWHLRCRRHYICASLYGVSYFPHIRFVHIEWLRLTRHLLRGGQDVARSRPHCQRVA